MIHRTPAIGWLLALFVLLASSYTIVNPLFEAPDEVWHYELVRWLAEGNGLPTPDDVGNAPWQQEGAQPPLYYMLGALLTAPIPTDNAATVMRYNPHANVGNAAAVDNKNMLAHGSWEDWPWQGVVLAAHVVRFLSVILGTVTVYFTWRSARLLLPNAASVAWLAAALVALNPQFLFISASISNDTLVTCCTTIGLWALLWIVSKHWKTATIPSTATLIGLGVILGVAALSKVSGLALSGLAAMVLVVLVFQSPARQRGDVWEQRTSLADARGSDISFLTLHPSPLTSLFRMGGLVTIVAGGISLWWYWRNWQLWGDPLAIVLLTAVLPGRDQPLSWHEIVSLLPGVWRSFWGVFGWFNVGMDAWLYTAYTVLCLVGVGGLLSRMRRLWHEIGGVSLPLLLLWIVLMGALVLRWSQINYPQGRLLFPALSAVSLLLAYGLVGWVPTRLRQGVAAALTVALFVPALIAPWRWIAPAYRPPATLASNTAIQQPLDVTFGDVLHLHGYALSKDNAGAGEPWTITLYWSALQPVTQDYSIFVHLLDENGIVQAQNDSFPAGGSVPTRAMQMNALVPDAHTLPIPLSVPTFSPLQIEIGVYDYQSGQRLLSQEGDHLLLGSISVGERRATDGSLLAINFSDKIELIDYQLDRTRLAPGESLTVDLTWRSLQTLSQDYVVFVHLLLPPDAVWAQIDEAPLQGQQPTTTWQQGQIIHDHHTLTLPPNAPSGVYRIEIGLYDRQTLDRLKVNLEDAGVSIGLVRVQ